MKGGGKGGAKLKADAVAFDCDGVLIDARRSYDRAIRVVVELMAGELTGAKLSLSRTAPKLISTVRRTGGFNSDWDATYALTLFSFVAATEARGGASRASTRLAEIVARFGSAPRGVGAAAVDSFLDREFPQLGGGLAEARQFLGYPGRPPQSRLATLFDEIYLGGPLFEKMHGVAPSKRRRGFIEMERTLVREGTLRSFERAVGRGRMAIVSGRPSLGTEYSLGDAVMGHFDRGASMFIGDADFYPELGFEYERFRKPSPDALVRASERLSSKTLLYVGDSAEDLMMVQRAKERGLLEGCLFAGVCGMSPDPKGQAAFFAEGGADLVVRSVNDIPPRLLMAGRGR
ncbi:MAG TPA: HAD family hydrolase [Nitrososphaerales archaeon]|nr:HAD family hydrolase [Nitrososphaerales archaeon]